MVFAILSKRLLSTTPIKTLVVPLSSALQGSREASPRSHRDIDWNRVLSLTASENQEMVMRARARHADLQVAILEAKEEAREIDFEDFKRKNVSDTLMASVKAAVESYEGPKVNIVDKIERIGEARREAAKHSVEYITQLEGEIREKEAMLEVVRSAKPPEEMTVRHSI
jgi:ATP synthase D subunit